MAAAVGRGRSRGIKGSRPPNTETSSINPPLVPNHDTPTPPTEETQLSPGPEQTPVPAATTPSSLAPTPASEPPASLPSPPDTPPSTPASVATACMDILRNPKIRKMSACYSDCVKTIQADMNIEDDSQIKEWLDSSLTELLSRRNRTLCWEFIQLLCAMQSEPSISNDTMKKTKAVFMRILGGMIGILAPEGTGNGQLKYATLTTIISEVAKHFKTNAGTHIVHLAPPILSCLKRLTLSGTDEKTLEEVYHILVRFGESLQLFLEKLGSNQASKPEEIAQDEEGLYDNIRNIIISDNTSENTRMKMLELIERRAYGYKVPEEILSYYRGG